MTRIGSFVLLLAIGCESVARSAAETSASADVPAVAVAAPTETKTHVKSSRRCGECHVAIAESWSASAHAGSATDPLYLAMRKEAGDASCDDCHVPLAPHVAPGSPIADEGVGCDACHTAERVDIADGRGRLILNPSDNVKRGPLCDARDHYFHRVACAPMFERSEICAGCHTLTRHAPGGAIAVHGEYDEWLAGPLGPRGSDSACQSCHMPGRDGEVAEGSGRTRYSAHGPIAGEPHGSPISVRLAIRAEHSDRLAIVASVRNEDAGHSLPTGLPGRRLVLTMRTLDRDRRELDRWQHTYGTRLVDAHGDEVPFYAATSIASDDRLAVGASREHALSLAAPDAVRLEVRIVRQSIAPALAGRLGVPLREQEIAAATLDIPAPGAARRRRLASPLEVLP